MTTKKTTTATAPRAVEATAQDADAAQSRPWANPTTGGLFRRNPQTGELTLADAPVSNPATQATPQE